MLTSSASGRKPDTQSLLCQLPKWQFRLLRLQQKKASAVLPVLNSVGLPQHPSSDSLNMIHLCLCMLSKMDVLEDGWVDFVAELLLACRLCWHGLLKQASVENMSGLKMIAAAKHTPWWQAWSVVAKHTSRGRLKAPACSAITQSSMIHPVTASCSCQCITLLCLPHSFSTVSCTGSKSILCSCCSWFTTVLQLLQIRPMVEHCVKSWTSASGC